LKFGERPSGHQEPILTERALVSVVDDDESVRESLPDLLREFGYIPRAFSSAEEFLASDCVGQTRCLILDVAMPGMTGPDLQRELMRRHYEIPIVWGPWRVCSSHSATLLYSRRSTTHFKPGNTLSADIR
jgi:PleD family two-component response regulator